jgi:hypothetical protein
MFEFDCIYELDRLCIVIQTERGSVEESGAENEVALLFRLTDLYYALLLIRLNLLSSHFT